MQTADNFHRPNECKLIARFIHHPQASPQIFRAKLNWTLAGAQSSSSRSNRFDEWWHNTQHDFIVRGMLPIAMIFGIIKRPHISFHRCCSGWEQYAHRTPHSYASKIEYFFLFVFIFLGTFCWLLPSICIFICVYECEAALCCVRMEESRRGEAIENKYYMHIYMTIRAFIPIINTKYIVDVVVMICGREQAKECPLPGVE